MVTAFETLLDIDNRRDFRKLIGDLCCELDESKQNYEIIDTRTCKTICDEQLTRKQIWAEEFYKCRHRFIHGDDACPHQLDTESTPHFKNATVFFRYCFRKKLETLPGFRYRSPATLSEKQNWAFDLDIDLLCDTRPEFDV